jgi:hypothetical protein
MEKCFADNFSRSERELVRMGPRVVTPVILPANECLLVSGRSLRKRMNLSDDPASYLVDVSALTVDHYGDQSRSHLLCGRPVTFPLFCRRRDCCSPGAIFN